MTRVRFAEFRDKIAALPDQPSYNKEQLVVDDFLLAASGNTTVYYAPFDYVNTSAHLVIVGLTPGWTQMNASFAEARAALHEGLSEADVLRRVKRVAAFSGTMRTNLVSMLDALGLPEPLDIDTTAQLFEPAHENALHSTSALRYPVFINDKNYPGKPPAAGKPILLPYLDLLAAELASVDGALIVPLGKAVEGILEVLTAKRALDPARALIGFPHPSGLNVRRSDLFDESRESMTRLVKGWFS